MPRNGKSGIIKHSPPNTRSRTSRAATTGSQRVGAAGKATPEREKDSLEREMTTCHTPTSSLFQTAVATPDADAQLSLSTNPYMPVASQENNVFSLQNHVEKGSQGITASSTPLTERVSAIPRPNSEPLKPRATRVSSGNTEQLTKLNVKSDVIRKSAPKSLSGLPGNHQGTLRLQTSHPNLTPVNSPIIANNCADKDVYRLSKRKFKNVYRLSKRADFA